MPIFEKQCPGDERPRKAIEVARRFAYGEASPEELRDGAAAWNAAWADARALDWEAARTAVGAVRAVDWSAAWAARSAAWDAGAVAWDDERQWQEQRLQQCLTEALHRLEMRQQLPAKERG